MKIRKHLKHAAVGLMALGASAIAFAGNVDQNDAFYSFYNTINVWTSGGLGVGLATASLLLGGAIGVAKNSPLPALSGVGAAAFLHWGPDIIQQIMLNGALV